MGPLVAGDRSTFDDTSTVILDLRDGLDFLNQEADGVKFLRHLGLDAFTFANHKIEWTETQLATREETITIDGSSTNLAVANAYQYQVNTLLRSENETMRVTAIADATHLTVVRGYVGSAAAHTAKTIYSVGSADPEGSDAPAAIMNKGQRLYNYDQTFTKSVGLTTDEIAKLSTQGEPMNKELEMRMIEIMRELARAVIYGQKKMDATNEVYAMGGLNEFITTNVYNIGGAASIANIDLAILDIVLAGGDPKLMTMHPRQKQKIDALDANLVRLGLKKPADNTGGNPITTTWQSGLLDHPIQIVSDQTFLNGEINLYDTDYIEIGHKSHNGVVGNFHVVDSTKPGADREEKTIRGKYTLRVGQEKAHARLYNLT